MTTQRARWTVIAVVLALTAAIAFVAASRHGSSDSMATVPVQKEQAQSPQPTQPPLNPVGGQPDGPPITPKPGGPLTPSVTTYKVDVVDFFLMPNDFVEYKFRLQTGAVMVFNWKATSPVEVDFHTVPDGKPISASETFLRGPASSGSGEYRAPYPGLHGWFWKNTSKQDVRLVLNASGFWTEARMYSGDPIGEPMELHDPAPPE